MNRTDKNYIHCVAQNSAGMMDSLHGLQLATSCGDIKPAWQIIYDLDFADVDGFTGVQVEIARLAELFADASPDWGESFDWIGAIDDAVSLYADFIRFGRPSPCNTYQTHTRPNEDQMRDLVKVAIVQNLHDKGANNE